MQNTKSLKTIINYFKNSKQKLIFASEYPKKKNQTPKLKISQKQSMQRNIHTCKYKWIENWTYLQLENSKSLPVFEKTITPTSASQRTASSRAFLSNPALLFENVTCLLFTFSIFFISIFPRPITQNQILNRTHKTQFKDLIETQKKFKKFLQFLSRVSIYIHTLYVNICMCVIFI